MLRSRLHISLFSALLVLLFIAVGIWVLNTGQQTVHTVTITKDEFVPAQITIKRGDTVVWVNEDDRLHWPASSYHPTHELYPEKQDTDCLGSAFDACRGLQLNEQWSFTFNTAGSFLYHDHLSPGRTGLVSVDNKDFFNKTFASLLQKVKDFQGSSITPKTFIQSDPYERLAIITEMSKTDPINAWKFLNDVVTVGNRGSLIRQLHEPGHIVGNWIYKEKGVQGITDCNPILIFACYHGVIEEALLQEGVEGLSRIEEVCDSFADANTNLLFACTHGTGHGLLTQSGYDVQEALTGCDRFKDTIPFEGTALEFLTKRTSCYHGVFMEQASVNSSTYAPKEDIWVFCLSQVTKYQTACMHTINIALGELGESREGILLTCQSAPSSFLQKQCIFEVSLFNYTKLSRGSLGDINDGIRSCKNIKETPLYAHCISVFGSAMIFDGIPDAYEKAQSICEELDSPWLQKCKQRNDDIITLYGDPGAFY